MVDLDGSLDSPPSKSVSAFVDWLVPAIFCGCVLVVLSVLSPFAGTVVASAGVTYLVTSLILLLALARRIQRRPARETRVAFLVFIWTAAWVVGVVPFGLLGPLGDVVRDPSGSPSGGFALDPVFWLLSFPVFLVFLVSALVLPERRRGPGYVSADPKRRDSTGGNSSNRPSGSVGASSR